MKRRESSFGNAFLKPFCFAKAFTENTSWKKRFTLVEIVLVLCSLFLVALPATVIAAEEDDYVLGIYGNANEDDTIDMRDLTYEKLIFFGKKPETELADAKYDGKINPLDFIQIKLIIVGKEKEITLVDSADRIVTVKKPVERIVILHTIHAMAIQLLNARDYIVGVDASTTQRKLEFPELSKLPLVGGSFGSQDYESVLNVNPDIVLAMAWGGSSTKFAERLPDSITVIGLDFHDESHLSEELTKLGYILDRKEEAEKFIDFYEGYMDMMRERVKGLSEDEKPRVYVGYVTYDFYLTHNSKAPLQSLFDVAGGRNIAANLNEKNWGSWSGFGGIYPEIDPEWLIEQNPDVIIGLAMRAKGYDTDDLSEVKEARDYLMNLPELAYLNAVKSDRIYIMPTKTMFGPTVFVGGIYYGKWFHPELFEDLDPLAIHQEYLTRFRRIDFNVYEHGVFVYHPELHPDGK